MESRNYSHPSVRRLRHALTAVRTGSISCVYNCFSVAITCPGLSGWNLACIIIIPACDDFLMLDFVGPKLQCSRSVIKLSMISKNHLQPFLSALLWIVHYHFNPHCSYPLRSNCFSVVFVFLVSCLCTTDFRFVKGWCSVWRIS